MVSVSRCGGLLTLSYRTFLMFWQGVVAGVLGSYVARMTINLWIPTDPVLAAIAPLGLAAVAGTALVIDAEPDGPNYPGPGSLADLVAVGPRRTDLEPSGRGVAVLRNGGIDWEAAGEVVAALQKGWSHVVIRHTGALRPMADSVAVVPDLPGALATRIAGPVVVQRTGWRGTGQGDLSLPRPSTHLIRLLLEGRLPGPSRWVRAWKPVWELA